MGMNRRSELPEEIAGDGADKRFAGLFEDRFLALDHAKTDCFDGAYVDVVVIDRHYDEFTMSA